jgi:GNAT superfamily N-acetyltransferase
MPVTVRPAWPSDGPALRRIERSAGERFRTVGLSDVADDQPASQEVLARYAADGRSWVAIDDAGTPIGYVLVDVVDGNAHVEQVSVDPGHQGVGVGRALLERVRAWAAAGAMPAVTLTTFADVAWNAPLYRDLGFRDLDEDDVGPGLRGLRDVEAARGLDPQRRVCMRRESQVT